MTKEEVMNCRSCGYMRIIGTAKRTGNNDWLKGPRSDCFCKHPEAVAAFNSICPRSPKMPGFIGYTPPGERYPAIKTSPKWCPLKMEPRTEGGLSKC